MSKQSMYDIGFRWCGLCGTWRKSKEDNRCEDCNQTMRFKPRQKKK